MKRHSSYESDTQIVSTKARVCACERRDLRATRRWRARGSWKARRQKSPSRDRASSLILSLSTLIISRQVRRRRSHNTLSSRRRGVHKAALLPWTPPSLLRTSIHPTCASSFDATFAHRPRYSPHSTSPRRAFSIHHSPNTPPIHTSLVFLASKRQRTPLPRKRARKLVALPSQPVMPRVVGAWLSRLERAACTQGSATHEQEAEQHRRIEQASLSQHGAQVQCGP